MTSNERQARAGERLSRASVNHRLLGWVVIGGRGIEHVAYEVAATPATDIPTTSWRYVRGDSRGTHLPWPRRYKRAGIVEPNVYAMVGLRESLRQREIPEETLEDAIAFQFGEYVMAAPLPDGIPPKLAMRVGHMTVAVTAGLYETDTRTFYAPENALMGDSSALVETDPVKSLIKAGDVPIY